MTGVLIAENDPMIRALLSLYIRQSKTYRVSASVACDDLQGRISCRYPVEIALLGVEGMPHAQYLREKFPQVRLIAITDAPEFSYIDRARQAQAESFWYLAPDAPALIRLLDATMEGLSVYPKLRSVYFGRVLSSELTERECQVLREVVSGSTDAQIAEKLGISLRTVKGHIQNLRGKTGYRNRTELAVQARTCGLIIV